MVLHLPITNPVLLFTVILFIILICPLLLERINIPSIIGLILCGVIVGPNGLNIIANDSAIDLLSTIGLLYLMFLIGLELDINEFKLNKYKSILFGILTFAIPLAAGYYVFDQLLHYDRTAALLISSTLATHTLIAYSIVNKHNIANNKSIAVTVGGTILADIAVLTLLAVLVNKSQLGIDTRFWIKMSLSLIIFLFIEFYVVPVTAKWFFKKFEGERLSHFIFVLLVLFLSSWFAEILGMEAIIGAFVSGIALNRFIPKTSNLMNKIEFTGNALFTPFFLVSVGMIVNVREIFQDYNIILIGVLLTVIGTAAKWVAALITQWICRFNKHQRNLIFGLSSAHTAASLAVIIAGHNAGIVGPEMLNSVIIFMLLTCVISPIVTQQTARKIASDPNNAGNMSNVVIPEEHFLIPYTNDVVYRNLLYFVSLIRNKKSSKPITLLKVVPNDETAEKKIMDIKASGLKLNKMASDFEINLDEVVTIDNNTVSAIVRICREKSTYPIIIPWMKSNTLSNLREERIRHVTESIYRSVYVCDVDQHFVQQKRIVVLAPELCELEIGFPLWLDKVYLLAQNLSIPVNVFSSDNTYNKVVEHLNIKKNQNVQHVTITDWHNFNLLAQQLRNDDIIIIIMSRKDFVSHDITFDNLPFKVEKQFKHNIKIAIYPYQSYTPENDITI